MKACATCKESLPLSSFTRRAASADGLHSSCKPCKNVGQRKYRQDPKGKRQRKGWEVRRRYGIDIDHWESMREEQGHACAICGDKQAALVVDHCHESGEVRGLLCNSCNKGLGFAKDSEEILMGMINYLKGGSDGLEI